MKVLRALAFWLLVALLGFALGWTVTLAAPLPPTVTPFPEATPIPPQGYVQCPAVLQGEYIAPPCPSCNPYYTVSVLVDAACARELAGTWPPAPNVAYSVTLTLEGPSPGWPGLPLVGK